MPENEIDLRKLSEPFDPKEVDFRIGQAGAKDGKPYAKVLAYIDARCIMDRLDDVVGPGNWKDRYWKEGTGEMCGLSIKVNGEWVEKVDGSEETDIEGFKGGISKALVRAGVKWGIGRYLYNLGDGWANIVPSGTKGARYQPKAKDGKYEAFNWLPPPLPEWAVPKKAAPAQSSGANGANVQAKTQQTSDAIKKGLANEQSGVSPESKKQASGAPGQGGTQAGIDQFFDDAGASSVASHQPKADTGAGGGPATASANAAKAGGNRTGNELPTTAGRPTQGAGPSEPLRDREGKVGAAKSDGESGGPGEQLGKPTGADAAKSGVKDGDAATRQGKGKDSGNLGSDSELRHGSEGVLPQGAGKSTGGAGKVGKPVPTTREEIDWFFGHMKEQIESVTTKNFLATLWQTNATTIEAMPEKERKELIALKDAAKVRLK